MQQNCNNAGSGPGGADGGGPGGRTHQDRGLFRPFRAWRLPSARLPSWWRKWRWTKINKAGGINGRPLELVIGDTESDPAKAATIVKKFIHSDKVAAIIGPTATGEGMQVKKIVEEAGLPIFMTVGGDPPIMAETGPFTYIFKSPQRSSTAVTRLFEYLKEKKLTKVALLTASDPFGKDGAAWLEKLGPQYGIIFVAKESFGPKDTDMTPQLTKIKNANPDAIICWTIGPAGAIVAKNKAQLGLTIPLFQCHGQPGPEYIKLAGNSLRR